MSVGLKSKVLRRYMDSHNFTVCSLADAMDVAPSTLYRIVKGERGVGSSFIAKLLHAFELTEEDFSKFFVLEEE